MKVGELIHYNACGMKNKTLGLILDIEKKHRYGNTVTCVLIQWCVIGEYMPRKDYRGGDVNPDISPGEVVWHVKGDWFEVSK